MQTESHVAAGGSNATGGANYTYNVTNFGKAGMTILVVCVGLSLGLAVGAVVIMVTGRDAQRELAAVQVAAVERRAMDAVYVAQQDAALAREDVRVLTAELNKRGIEISTSH
jgi:hypothetical protein